MLGDAVDHAEVDRLGAAPNHRVHTLDGDAEHFRCRHRVNIVALMKCRP